MNTKKLKGLSIIFFLIVLSMFAFSITVPDGGVAY